jgi:hypothetical protein
MVSERIELVDVDPEHWLNLVRLSRGELMPRGPSKEHKEKPAALSLLVEGGRVIKANHSLEGTIPGYEPKAGLDDLAALAEAEEVDRLTVIERGAPRRIMHNVQSALSLDKNFVEQGLTIYGAIREEMGKGLRIHPRPKMPDVKYVAISTAVKMALAAGELLVIVIYSDDGKIKDSSGLPIVTSIILKINDRAETELLTTTDSLVSAGLKVNDWKKDYKQVNDLAKKVWDSKVFLGVHIPLSTVPELARAGAKNEGPKALLALHKSGGLIMDPLPLRFKMMLKMGGMMGR